jgi:hypothetical protein
MCMSFALPYILLHGPDNSKSVKYLGDSRRGDTRKYFLPHQKNLWGGPTGRTQSINFELFAL